jgi:hypothetical protein
VWDVPGFCICEIIGIHDVILLSDQLSYLPGISRAEMKLMIGPANIRAKSIQQNIIVRIRIG